MKKKSYKTSFKEKAKAIPLCVILPAVWVTDKLLQACKLLNMNRRKALTSVLAVAMMLTALPVMPFTAFAANDTPLTFTAETAGSTVTLNYKSGSDVKVKLGSDEWTDYTKGTAITLENENDTVSFKGTGVATDNGNHFSMTGKIAASGDVTSLTNGVGGDTTLTNYCYYSMFNGCTSLTTAPELPATKLTTSCYNGMFQGCTSLITPPELPATNIASSCYQNMFCDCTGLTEAPELPATTLAMYCYASMFYNCTSLKTAPVLPATTMANRCYLGMFESCKSLTAPPELPATTLAVDCYYYMFAYCTSLKVSNTQTGNYTKAWRLPPEGTITTTASGWNTDMLYGTNGDFKGAPSANTTYYIYVEPNPLTFTAETAGSTVTLNYKSATWLQYQDSDGNWQNYIKGTKITLTNAGDTVRFRGGDVTTDYSNFFSMTGKLAASGDVTSLTNGVGGDATLSSSCYYNMFRNCTSLTTAPELPAATLASDCYSYMFYGCTSLTEAPKLPATTLASDCYSYMFYGCTKLTAAPALNAENLLDYCYTNMFEDCTGLTAPPELPATTLAKSCYSYMFKGCTSLKVGATQTGDYNKEWRIPTTGDITVAASGWNTSMLAGTTGTFTSNPTENTTYYIYEDITPPAISGIEDGKTYCQTAEFTVTDDNLDTVTLNDSTLTAVNGTYTLAEVGTNTVVATDKAGNSTTVTVTINADHVDADNDNVCDVCGANLKIISVTITWGSLEFTYTDASEGTWNPETLSYENPTPAAWTCDTDENKITVTSESSMALTASFSYEQAEGVTVTGSFTDGTDPITAALPIAKGNETPQTVAAYLKLDGKPEETANRMVVGTVTVTIGE